MTYAAQVRSITKSVSAQPIKDDFYDFNSLRIICKYLVGSVVTIKTIDEVIEGVLQTIYNNKICITYVTIAKANSPDIITETAHIKSINLGDVLFISTTESDKQEVVVKGKFFKVDLELKDQINDSTKKNQKSASKVINNGKLPCKKPIVIKQSEIVEENTKSSLNNEDDKPVEPSMEDSSKNEKSPEIKEPKKVFSFNPNAPEFKPRSNVAFSENVNGHILFSPHAQQFPPVFTPNSAPAIFVPNIFFYAPNQPINNIENCSFDNINNSETKPEVPLARNMNIDEQFVRKPIPDIHIANPSIPFPQMMPLFPPPLPIFVPNHSFKFNGLPYNNVEINNNTELANNVDSVESSDSPNDNELSDPLNWPPLPVPTNQIANNSENNQK